MNQPEGPMQFIYLFRYPDNATVSVKATNLQQAWASLPVARCAPDVEDQDGPVLESVHQVHSEEQIATAIALQVLKRDRDQLLAKVEKLTADLSGAQCDKATLEGTCRAMMARLKELEEGSERLKVRVTVLTSEVLAQNENEKHLQERIAFWKRQAGGLG